MKKQYQPKTGQRCSCKPGQERDNCHTCEGTGQVIDFAAIRAAKTTGNYRTADGKAQIEWSLEQKENGLEFSASGDFDGSGGQNIDGIAKAYPHDKMVQRIRKVWERYHLNGMNAGLPEQEAFLKANESQRGTLDHCDWACATLKDAGLYEIPLPEGMKATGGFPEEVTSGKRGYRYGERWVFSGIPTDVIAEIESWSSAEQPRESLHEFKAKEFLATHGLNFRATLSDSKPAQWEPAGHHYRITVSRERTKGSRLVFDFWGSQADQENGRREVSAYDVLACVASDVHTPETFEDYCAEFGESDDSLKARQTFRRASAFAKRLRAFFTDEEVEALQEIR